jgi:hypothetical protein
MRKIIRLALEWALLIQLVFFGQHLMAQSASDPAVKNTATTPAYPYVKGYLSFIFPVVTINKNETTPNFKETTTIGFPVGVNVYYSDRFGFSYEFTPSIVASKPTGKPGTSKTSNLLFDPGPMFRFKNSFTIITRLAFETAGRYGFTPVFNKVYLKTKAVNYFIAGSLPVRFGNSAPASIGASVQFGFIFN